MIYPSNQTNITIVGSEDGLVQASSLDQAAQQFVVLATGTGSVEFQRLLGEDRRRIQAMSALRFHLTQTLLACSEFLIRMAIALEK
jgi:negative regulator of sigma E activity